MTKGPIKPSLFLVKSNEAGFPPRNLNNIKFTALFNQVALSCQILEELRGVVAGNTALLQHLLGVLERDKNAL